MLPIRKLSNVLAAKSEPAKNRSGLKAIPDEDSLDSLGSLGSLGSPEWPGRAKIREPAAKSQSSKERPKLKATPDDEDDLDSPERPGRAKSQSTKERPKLKAASDEDSLDSLERPSRAKLRAPAAKSQAAKERPKLKAAPGEDNLDSLEQPRRAKLQAPDDLLSLPKERPRRRFVKPSQDTNDNDSSQASPARTLTLRQTAPQNQKPGKHTKTLWTKATPPKPRGPKFKAPGDVSEASLAGSQGDSYDGSNSSELSELSDLESLDSQYAPEISIPPPSNTTACPWCGEEVAERLLKDFSKGKRLNVRMQTRFCKKHKKTAAMETWNERNYPDPIPWPTLKDRFSSHRLPLLSIVRGSPSHFRSVLASKIETGQARNLKKEENLNPGYYGSRGFNLMCDWLVGEFGDMLKEKAVTDRVIAGRGSAAFIESVLVAELAVRLIGEDMGVGVEEARAVLEESKALGDIVHDAE